MDYANFTGRQCAAARALLGWSQQDLSAEVKVSSRTIQAFERGATKPHPVTLEAIEVVFAMQGIVFLHEGGVNFEHRNLAE